MAVTKVTGDRTVQDAREAYFAGMISAEEYLRTALPSPAHNQRLAEQLRRILHRLTTRLRQG